MIRFHRHHKRRIPEPTRLAWLLLLSAWVAAVSVFAVLFYNLKNDRNGTDQGMLFLLPEKLQQSKLVLNASDAEHSPSITCTSTVLPPVDSLRSADPTILIYHTHTTEAYTQTQSETYRENGKWRTKDNTRNMIAVGETLKEILERDYGFTVIHDTTDHEPPKLATAYDRSLLTMERYHREYPSIVLFIDLHRDAYAADNAPCDYLVINGVETARLMLVVGKGEKYADKPYYESNIAFAERITAHLNGISPKLCRPVRVKTGRYNQHVAPNCILVEVGHNANTLAQAKAAMPYLAESIAYTFSQNRISLSDWLPI